MSKMLGYVFHPDDAGHCFGFRGFDFNLYGHPTGEHFDPEEATVPVAQVEGGVVRLTFGHPWSGPETMRVCAGRITLHDRAGHAVEAFSLGGRLAVEDRGDHTVCRLASSAPIFESVVTPGIDEGDVEAFVVQEIETVLAQRSARWVDDPPELDRRLARIEPAVLYAVVLATIGERIGHIPFERRTELYRLTDATIREEIRRLRSRGRWPARLPALEDSL